ncbi:hypothetical protein [uncultured Desulfovibrio sp.]|uniref:hypothetical protein n=1 Tax=uncultured Desulfovibrio sp. TaxID=167968 RepID=UPI00258B06D3|nr:hypothetical protein [uncultured Desulfovibrio sp.]
MAGVYGNMLAIPNRGRGGALPTYQGGNQPYTPGANVSARLSDAGGQIAGAAAESSARALGNLAGAADRAVQTGVRAYEDYSKTRATQLLVEYQTRVNDAMYGEGGILTRKGDAAFYADKELARRSRQIREEVLGDYKGSLAGNFFDVRIREFDANNMLKAQKYRGDQYDAWSFREDIAAADMFAKRAAQNYANPEEFIRDAAQAEWHIKSALGRKGYGPEAMAKGIADARSAVLGMSIQQAIANGDMAGAERLLHQYGGGGRGSVGGSTSSRNLAANNFGNVKNSAGGFNAYATREDGLMGVGERVLRYNNAPERGWKAQTLEEMTAIYAPDSDGNDSKGYAAFLAKKLGVAPDAKINFRDPKILAGLIRWMPVMEHGGDRVNISAEEADKAAKELLEGKKPRITGAAEGVASNSTGGAAPSLFGLSPADRMKFQRWIEAGKRERMQEANLTASAFGNQIAYGMDKGDFSHAEATISKLESLGARKEAAELQDQLTLSRQAWAALDGTRGLPLLEQAVAAHKDIDTLVTPDNARAAVAMRGRVDAEIERRKKAFLADPAGYVSALPGMQGDMDFQERTRRNLMLQEEAGKGLAFAPRVLPHSQAEQMRAAYDKLTTPEQQLQWLQQIRQSGGEYSQQMLAEMKMPEAVMAITPVLPVLPQKDAALWLSAATLKPSDIPKVDNDAKKQAEDTVANSDFMSVFYAAAQKYPTNSVLRGMAAGLENTMKNALLLGMDSGKLEDVFSLVAASNCILLLPKSEGLDADEVAAAISESREHLAERLIADLVKEPKTPQGRNYAANLRSMVRDGTVISTGVGREAVLLDPWQGNPVLQPDGTPIRFDLAAIAKERTERRARVQEAAEESED